MSQCEPKIDICGCAVLIREKLPVTSRIRLYGTDCAQFQLVQQAIQQTQTYARFYLYGRPSADTKFPPPGICMYSLAYTLMGVSSPWHPI
jgi:hypothetical protein